MVGGTQWGCMIQVYKLEKRVSTIRLMQSSTPVPYGQHRVVGLADTVPFLQQNHIKLASMGVEPAGEQA